MLVGRCYEIDGAPPYVPFVEIFEQALAAAPSPEAMWALLGDDAPEVAKLLPRLRRQFPDIPPPLELPPEQERHYLFNSLRDSLARAAAGRPLFVVLDDLHWADEERSCCSNTWPNTSPTWPSWPWVLPRHGGDPR